MLIAIEIGGTFTDLIAVDNDGRYIEMKVSSTPRDPSLGALNALNVLLNEFEVETGEIKEILHGSTVATNAVIQRKGPTVGLLITEGFRDVPFIQRQNRGEALYTWRFEKPQHVVARKAIAEIKERLNAKGEVLIQLDHEEAKEAVDNLLRKNHEIDSLAVCFLHSYANPSHERKMEELIHKRYPDMEVCLSSEILPQFREYERTSTTLLTAYMKPVVNSYLHGLKGKLAEVGVHSNVYVCRSSGGILPVSAIVKYPAEMLVSGPAAGVTGAIHISKQYDMDNMMTVDMGGTSTDVSLITGGVPEITTESSIDGLPLAMPMIDIITIGAGGGSIAWIDSGGMMRVGPQSAGADPGPACYNMGGKDPTITDALVLNGYIRKEKFIGGKMELSAEMAKKSMDNLAQALKVSEHEVAENIIGITISNVAQAMRIVSVERGYDPRDYVLCVYGGAGPLFAAYLAKELNLRGCLVPESPGTFSARGLLVSDYKRDYVHSLFCRVADVSPEKIIEAFDSLKEKAVAEFEQLSIPMGNIDFRFSLDLRYSGQQYELTVPVCIDDLRDRGMDLLEREFNQAHLRRYGHYSSKEKIEIANVRISVTSHRERISFHDRSKRESSHPQSRIPSRIFHDGNFIDCSFVNRDSLSSDFSSKGPLIIEEDTSTTFVPPGFKVAVGKFHDLFIEKVT